MPIAMIDREEIVQHFQKMLEPQSPHRILRLLGEAKMGKTHLLTRVMPSLARQCNVHPMVLDLRNSQETIISHLVNACGQMDFHHFSNFDQVYTEWQRRPHIQMNSFRAVFSIVSARSRSHEDDTERIIPQLTRSFVEDLKFIDDRPVVLIFDQVDDAAQATQNWLMYNLLVHLHSLEHVRVVVGGRIIPEMSGSYALRCLNYELRPVQKVDAYVDYCREVGAELAEQSIPDFAKASRYAPGAFAETILAFFVPKDVSHV